MLKKENKKRYPFWEVLELKELIEFYEQLYQLPLITNEVKVGREAFLHCGKGRLFILLNIFNQDKKLLLQTKIYHPTIWELPGGYLDPDDHGLEEAALRIASAINISIDELCPSAVIKNVFKHGSDAITHYGISFVGTCRNNSEIVNSDEIINVFENKPLEEIVEYDQKVVEYSYELAKKTNFCPPFNEIDETGNLGWRQIVHRGIVKPVTSLFTSPALRKHLYNQISGKLVLDASCGDDSVVIDWANRNPESRCILNDITWSAISKVISKAKKRNILFTNHDVFHLPYKIQPDTVIFKNTLHHIEPSLREPLIKNLLDLAKSKLIVIDVKDPKSTSKSHEIWNKYYTNFLKDQGHHFMNSDDFEEICKKIHNKVKFETIVTAKGVYMSAIFEK